MSYEKIQEQIADYHKKTVDGVGLLKSDIDNLKKDIANLLDQPDPRRPIKPNGSTPADGTSGGYEEPNNDGYRYVSNDLAGQKYRIINSKQSVSRSLGDAIPQIDPRENVLTNTLRHKLGMRLPENVAVSSSAVVPDYLAAQVIDDVRAKSTVMRAGTTTFSVTTGGTTTFGRNVGDPTIFEHAEGVEDLTESDVLFDGVEAKPITIAGLVPVSMELLYDSSNIEQILYSAYAGAFAGKVDTMFLTQLLADANIPTSAAGQNPAAWAGVLAAVTAALAADQDLPQAFIGSEADFMARASLTTTDGAWLGKPPVLSGMNELYSTRVDDGTAIFGDFAGSAMLCTWVNNFSIEVLKFKNPNAMTHLCIAYLRVKPVVVQPKRLFIQKATVE